MQGLVGGLKWRLIAARASEEIGHYGHGIGLCNKNGRSLETSGRVFLSLYLDATNIFGD